MAKVKVQETALALDSMRAEAVAKSEGLSASKVLQQAERLEINSADDYELAAEWLKGVKGRLKTVEDQRTELVRPLNGVVKRINELFRHPLDLLARAEARLKQKMLGWQQEEGRRVKAEQERLWLAAQKEEETLRKRAEDRAVKAEAEGDLAKAAGIRETLPVVPVQIAAPAEIPKIAALRTRVVWKVEVVDFALLVKAVAAGEVPLSVLQADQVFLHRIAREQRDTLRWPGVRVWSEQEMASGRA